MKSHKLKEKNKKNKNAIEKFCNSGRRDNMIIKDYTLEIRLYNKIFCTRQNLTKKLRELRKIYVKNSSQNRQKQIIYFDFM